MKTSLTHPESVAVSRLHALLELLPTELDRRLGSAGVTSFEYTLLDILASAEGHRMRLSELARRTNATLPRLSRVVSSLERRDLIGRAPCLEDGRATNAVLTENGANVHSVASGLYAEAVRELVLSGLGDLPGDGVSQLSDLAYAMLKSLDPAFRDATTAPQTEVQTCAADPVEPTTESACAADPTPPPAKEVCAADPVLTSASILEGA